MSVQMGHNLRYSEFMMVAEYFREIEIHTSRFYQHAFEFERQATDILAWVFQINYKLQINYPIEHLKWNAAVTNQRHHDKDSGGPYIGMITFAMGVTDSDWKQKPDIKHQCKLMGHALEWLIHSFKPDIKTLDHATVVAEITKDGDFRSLARLTQVKRRHEAEERRAADLLLKKSRDEIRARMNQPKPTSPTPTPPPTSSPTPTPAKPSAPPPTKPTSPTPTPPPTKPTSPTSPPPIEFSSPTSQAPAGPDNPMPKVGAQPTANGFSRSKEGFLDWLFEGSIPGKPDKPNGVYLFRENRTRLITEDKLNILATLFFSEE